MVCSNLPTGEYISSANWDNSTLGYGSEIFGFSGKDFGSFFASGYVFGGLYSETGGLGCSVSNCLLISTSLGAYSACSGY